MSELERPLRRIRPMRVVPKPPEPVTYLNCAPGFWDTYRRTCGSLRRKALLALFQRHPEAKLPVNNHYQANLLDTDLSLLVKRGKLRQVREGGGRRHPLNKTGSKRQTYLVLV